MSLADSGTQLRVIASVPPISATSSVATLTVTLDTTPPVATVGAMPDATAGVVDIGVGSNKPVDNASASLLPHAWCRIQRVGQTFTIFRSSDGVNWTRLGATTWGVDDQTKTPMPATVYVGPEYSPENGNITQMTDRGTFLAQFRDYGDVVAGFNPQLKPTVSGGKVTLTWTSGTLVSSPTIKGTYAPVSGASSPFTVTPAPGTMLFYQVTP